MEQLEEFWTPAYNDPDYEVSSLGRVRNLSGKIISLHSIPSGRLRVKLSNGKWKQVDILVLESFGFFRKTNQLVTHLDKNLKNNKLSNLEWGQPKEKICTFNLCNRKSKARGLCVSHWQQWKDGKPLTPIRHMSPRGSGNVNQGGYRMVWKPDHPNSTKFGKIAEHRFIMSEILGRPLYDFEEVHHKNGIRLDNRPENLELWVRRQPPGQRADDLLNWAEELLALYRPERLNDNTRRDS